MPPKTARNSTTSAAAAVPVKKKRLIRNSELTADNNDVDERKVLYKDAERNEEEKPSEKHSVEEKSESKREPIKETGKETKKEIKEEKEEKPADKQEEEKKAVEKEKEDKKTEEMDYEEEEYEELLDEEETTAEEETTGVDYEPEENHRDEYVQEEIEEIEADDYQEVEPIYDDNSNQNDDQNENDNHSDSLSSSSSSEEEKEHHEVINEHRKRKEFEVFVGGLDKDATESDLRRVFSEMGEITEVRLLVNPATRKNKGFGFLRFATIEQAKRVVRDFKPPLVLGRRCGVAASHDNDTLFVGNICKTWTKEHLKETLKGFGVDNFEDIKLVEDPHNEGMNRGFAFLEFTSRDEALEALKRLQKRDVNLGTDRIPKVAFSDSFKELDDEVMSQVTTVFIDHLPPAWDEDKIRKHLKKYGSIQKIELARNMPSAKRRDFGFVTFETHDNAISCINGISGIELGEGDKAVKLKARLSRPTKKEHRPRRISMTSSYPYPPYSRSPFPPTRRPGPYDSSSYRSPFPRSSFPPTRRPGPPPRRFGAPPPRATLRVAPIGSSGSRVVRRVISSDLDSRRPVVTVSERLPPVRFRAPVSVNRGSSRPERLPPPPPIRRPGPGYVKRERGGERGRGEREYALREEELPLPPPPPSRRPRNTYEDEYSQRLPPPPSQAAYSDIAPRGMNSRGADRRAFLEEDYGGGRNGGKQHDERGGNERGGRARDYSDNVYGNKDYNTKRPYSDLDDGPRHGEAVRNSRARIDNYSSGPAGNNYTDSYGGRMGGRGYGGAGSNRNSMYGNRQGMNYNTGGQGRGNDVENMYSSGFGGSSYLSRGSDGGGGSYPSVYSNRSLGGGAGSNSYY